MKTSQALAVAKTIVGRTFNEAYAPGKERFICCALMTASEEGRITRHDYIRVAGLVEARLKPHTSLEAWLVDQRAFTNPYQHSKEERDRVQQHRHAWLDLMIAEFKAQGD